MTLDIENIDSAWKGHRKFAEWLVNRTNPEVIVDLGVDNGFSTFCFGTPRIGHVYGVDSFEGDPCAGKRDIRTYWGVLQVQEELKMRDNITFIKCYFDELATVWNKPIDILHIDGNHSYEAVKEDFFTWCRFLKDDGVILMHDTFVFQPGFGVNRFFEEIPFPKINFTNSYGLGVVTHNQQLLNEIKRQFGDLDILQQS